MPAQTSRKSASRSRIVSRCALAIRVDRHAVHILHDQVGQPVVGGAAVKQLRDVGMVQQRQDLALLTEAHEEKLRRARGQHDLDRDLLVESIVTAGEVHDTHAAASDLALEAIRTNSPARLHPIERREVGAEDRRRGDFEKVRVVVSASSDSTSVCSAASPVHAAATYADRSVAGRSRARCSTSFTTQREVGFEVGAYDRSKPL